MNDLKTTAKMAYEVIFLIFVFFFYVIGLYIEYNEVRILVVLRSN